VSWGVEKFIGMIAAIRFAKSVINPYKRVTFCLDLYVNSMSILYSRKDGIANRGERVDRTYIKYYMSFLFVKKVLHFVV